MKASSPKGMRDRFGMEIRQRRYVTDILQSVFESFGFEPLETPAMEYIENLSGSYGEEGQKLIFRILKRGSSGSHGDVDLGLRYDLTVPLSRYVAMKPDLQLPFKRYQVQPVWRADRPQRGRFREFLQCDVDIVGAKPPYPDAEVISVISAALLRLDIDSFQIRLNHRGVLSSIMRSADAQEWEQDILTALDKLDKLTSESVIAEMCARDVPLKIATQILQMITSIGAPEELYEWLDEEGRHAIRQLRQIMDLTSHLGVRSELLRFDPTLVRGLDYYTGVIFETQLSNESIGSVTGGGRYDELIGKFGGRNLPAVGVSFGVDRILSVLESKLAGDAFHTADILVAVFSEDMAPASLKLSHLLRSNGINTDLWLEAGGNLSRQFRYAQMRNIAWVAIVGPEEEKKNLISIKNVITRDQKSLSVEAAINLMKSYIHSGTRVSPSSN